MIIIILIVLTAFVKLLQHSFTVSHSLTLIKTDSLSQNCSNLWFNLELTCNPSFIYVSYRPERLERGGPLLTVETEVNGDSKSTYERSPSLVGSLGLSYRYKRFLLCLGCSSQLRRKYFFPHSILFQFLCPIDQQAGQTAVLGRLSLNMCLWYRLSPNFSPSFYELLTYNIPPPPALQETILSQLFLCFLRKPFLSIHTHGQNNPSDRTPINCKKVHKCTLSSLAKTASPPPSDQNFCF